MKLLLRLLVSALAFWIAAELLAVGGPLSGILGDDRGIVLAEDRFSGAWFFTLIVVALIFGVVNAVLQPIIRTIGCAAYALTLGLIALVVNGLLLLLTSWIAHSLLDLAFQVHGFWAAIIGALVIGAVSWLLNRFVTDRR